MRMLDSEVSELWSIAIVGNAAPEEISAECADVANYAMMLADVVQRRRTEE